MNSKYWKAIRLFLMTPGELLFVRQLKKSGLFDRQFYRSTNPTLHRLYHLFPERHFVLIGERAGLYPNPDFSPNAYLTHNPDVATHGARPFQHYLRQGHREARITKHFAEIEPGLALPAPNLRARPGRKAPHAVVAHLFYHELWDEFLDILRGLDFGFDLYVTITAKDSGPGRDSAALKARILQDWPEARVVEMRNHGRDIFPFVHLVNAGWLSGYDAVAKIHSKKSPHRSDGDKWRQHLIRGILPEKGAAALLEKFKADPSVAYLVADGQHYTGTEWWGSNFERVRQILERVEIPVRKDHLSFPAGSIYWLKPLMIEMIRGLHLSESMFETELSQTDGTLAHAVERALGALAEASGHRILQVTELQRAAVPAPSARPSYVQAFYLPQFHPVRENDAWWGKGFTEWTGVSRAKPQFAGHMQPQLPADLGFYDLRLTEVMGEQTALARAAGIDAFAVYHYWFDGRRILEAPIDRLLARPEVDFPFYLVWANESWRRNWDGLSGEVLLAQSYAPGWEDSFAESLLPYFRDPRYQRPDGTRPRFVIYRPEDMPDPAGAVARLRAAWARLGVGAVELGAVRFHRAGENPVQDRLFDFWIEMPPHALVQSDDYLFGGKDGNRLGALVSGGFEGLIYDYLRLADRSVQPGYLAGLPANTIAGIMPSWDNSARRGAKAHLAYGANPASFDRWLGRLLGERLGRSYRGELFLNAWNEWGEKAMLEPSAQWGRAMLDVLARRLGRGTTLDAGDDHGV